MARRFSVCMAVITAMLVVLLAAAASASTRVEIMMKVEDRSEECGQQIRVSYCGDYLRDSSRLLLLINDRAGGGGGGGWREEFPRCCEELERIEQHCRCQAVKQVAQEQRQVGGLQAREMQEMLETAKSLPSLCRLEPQSCQIVERDPSTFY